MVSPDPVRVVGRRAHVPRARVRGIRAWVVGAGPAAGPRPAAIRSAVVVLPTLLLSLLLSLLLAALPTVAPASAATPAAAPVPAAGVSAGTSSDGRISVTKTASTTTLPAGGGSVTYTFVVTNTSGRTMWYEGVSDDRCGNPTYVSGMSYYDDWGTPVYYLDPGQSASWRCTQVLTQTTTNIVTADFSDVNYVHSIATATATVTVGATGGGGGGGATSCNTLWYASDYNSSGNTATGGYGSVGTVTSGGVTAPRYTINNPTIGLYGSAAVGVSPVNPNLVYFIPRNGSASSTYGGLIVFDGATNTATEVATAAATPDAVKLTVAPDGSVWVIAPTGYVWQWTSAGGWVNRGAVVTTNNYDFGTGAASNGTLGSGDIVFDGLQTMWVIGSTTNGTAFLYTMAWTDLLDGGTATARLVGSMGSGEYNGLAFTEDGTLWATTISGTGGALFTVNKETGSASPIASIPGQFTTDLGSCGLPKPQLTITKEVSPSGTVRAGDVLTYTIKVTNLGTLSAVGTTLTDTLPTDVTYVAGSAQLNGAQVTTGSTFPYAAAREIHTPGENTGIVAPAETATVTFRATVGSTTTRVCNQGSTVFVGSAVGGVLSDDPNLPGASDATCSTVVVPIIAVDKTAPVTVLSTSPQLVTYSYAVTNVGTEPLRSVALVDNKCAGAAYVSGDANLDAILQTTETWVYTCTASLTGTTTNTATATGVGAGSGATTTATDTWTVTKPTTTLSIVKSNGGLLDLDGNGADAGDQIDYSYLVTNTGQVTLTSITVTDSKIASAAIVCPATTLAPGASTTCRSSYVVTPADITSGSVTNTASAGGQSAFGTTTSATVSNTVALPPLQTSGGIDVIKTAAPTTLPVGGGSVTYTYTVSNTSNVRLYYDSSSDDKCSPVTRVGGSSTYLWGLGTFYYIDPTRSMTFTCTTTLARSTTNTATFDFFSAYSSRGYYYRDTTYTEQDTATVTVARPAPIIALTKAAGAVTDVGGNGQDAGDQLAYTFTVTNPGNVPLSPVTITDAKCDANTLTRTGGDTLSDNILQTTETWTYTCRYTLLAADLVAGTVHNTATVTGNYGSIVASSSASADKTLAKPLLDLTKSAGTLTVAADHDTVTYTVTVSNSGGAVGYYGPITDTPAFDPSLTPTTARWSGPNGSTPTGNTTLSATVTSFLIGSVTPIAAGATHTYQVSIDFTAGTVAASTCAGPGTGLANRVALPSGQEGGPVEDNTACVAPPTTFALAKSAAGGSAGGTGSAVNAGLDGTVTATYQITVTNTGHTAGQHPSITDQVTLPAGFSLTSVAVNGASATVTNGSFVITGSTLAVGATRTYMVVVVAHVADLRATDWVAAGRCSTSGAGTPTEGGAFNIASLPGDSDGVDNNDACVPELAPLATVTVTKYGTSCDVGIDQCPLTGAQFVLYAANPATGATALADTFTPDATGTTHTSTPLPTEHDYWLVETVAPQGYNLLAQPVRFTLTAAGVRLGGDPAGTSTTITTPVDSPFTISVVDTTIGNLPEAGGTGPWPFLVVGLLLVLAGGWNHRRAIGPAASG